ncbi:hypothetical protein HNP37_004515 [Flavobacterium nitrogenifigens]|uniref:Uncharacterized protein n=2 Tax=Flavobacterium TaxID=237 RepID=A0A7W7N911_9FLAO|nr:hypothetical protein [Flavobacterium nitrogenifigens]MBB6389449.1 hypothetical protein [Flavobacterium notoginsengisoli]
MFFSNVVKITLCIFQKKEVIFEKYVFCLNYHKVNVECLFFNMLINLTKILHKESIF